MTTYRATFIALAVAAQSLVCSATLRAQTEEPKPAVAPFDAQQAQQHQQAWAKYLNSDAESANTIGMKFRVIPAGEFTMGSPDGETYHAKQETQHRVRITKPVYLGKYEVTQGEWKAVMQTEPWKGKSKEGNNFPAVWVSWKEAVEFCQKLSQKEGKTYRLPTEAEWEYACRGGTTTAFYFGNDENDLPDYAWWGAYEVAVIGPEGSAKNEPFAHEVGLKKSNPFGLHDMHGNVWEWCQDWYDENYYASSPTDDPQGPETGTRRVYRGGDWHSFKPACRSAERSMGSPPSNRFEYAGFRVVRVR